MKHKDYLPLYWCKKIEDVFHDKIRKDIDHIEMRGIYSSKLQGKSNPEAVFDYFTSIAEPEYHGASTTVKSGLAQASLAVSLIRQWSVNKQVFKFDGDFIDELLKTEDIFVEQDMFSFLPFKTFFVDISEHEELCKSLDISGYYITVIPMDNYYLFSYCLVNADNGFLYASSMIENTTFQLDITKESTTMRFMELLDNETFKITPKAFNTKIFDKLSLQILLYLSSVEPDIAENEVTRTTYRKPTFEPKNKFSEIQQWDVGVRFGTSIRNWRKKQASSVGGNASGRRLRPHARRAHWQHYWYGKRDGERVRRPKWVSECFVNVQPEDELPAVIHKADSESEAKTTVFN